jgi:glycosyltransferase involved in cell wall biosynthesis
VTLRPGTTIALDFRWLDHLNIGNGQYRYCSALIDGLSKLGGEVRFVVIGSRVAPPDSLGQVFRDRARWRYRELPTWKIRGNYYFDHVRYGWLLRQERVDLVHSLHTFLPWLGPRRRVVTIYDMMLELFPEYREAVVSRPYRFFKAAIQRTHPSIIAISRTTADDLHRLWTIPLSTITVVHLSAASVDPRRGAAIEHVAALKAPFVLTPFNLEPRKNLLSLVRAMADVRRTHADVRLVLYGRAAVTPEREHQFERDVRELGLQDAVVLTGPVSDGELGFLHQRAVLFVFPSLYEGFGLPVLDAMAAGLCTVARNQSAMAEVLGDAGVQIETSDPMLLATTISSLLDNPKRRADLGHAGRRRSSQFTSDLMARRTLAVYEKALGTSNA